MKRHDSQTRSEILKPEKLAQINSEMQYFMELYDSDHFILRFKYHKPQALANSISELALERKDYNSDLTGLTEPKVFITEDEIDASLSGSSGMSGGKLRIYQFFEEHTDRKERISFLKNEYGTGGRSHAVSGSDRSGESHDAKGIQLSKGSCPKVNLSWSQVSNRIAEMIRKDLYLNEKEKEALHPDEPVQKYPAETKPVATELTETIAEEQVIEEPAAGKADTLYHQGDTVYQDDTRS